jgi:hypothetical protein
VCETIFIRIAHCDTRFRTSTAEIARFEAYFCNTSPYPSSSDGSGSADFNDPSGDDYGTVDK